MKDVRTLRAVEDSRNAFLHMLEAFEQGKVRASTLRNVVALHMQTVKQAQGEDLDGALAG